MPKDFSRTSRLGEQIQREVDDVKVVPVPTPEPLESTPQ